MLISSTHVSINPNAPLLVLGTSRTPTFEDRIALLATGTEGEYARLRYYVTPLTDSFVSPRALLPFAVYPDPQRHAVLETMQPPE